MVDLLSTISLRFRKIIVFHLHGGGLPDLFARKPNWTRRVLRRGAAIVAPSAFLARAVSHLGLECIEIPNVIETADYPFRLRSCIRPKLFWMRSFHPLWNPMMAVMTVDKLRRSGTEAQLVMGGNDKGSRNDVQDLVRKLDLEDFIHFPGFLQFKDKLSYGNDSDVFLNTNRVDNTPVSVIEACAMGIPVISTNVGGIPDLLTDQISGLLVPSDNSDDMAKAVRRLLNDQELVQCLSRNGRKLAEQFSWEVVRLQWLQLHSVLMNK
jgi:glycosyltransferase involved in cell wall biosynthesis